jgi:hypothetical protein
MTYIDEIDGYDYDVCDDLKNLNFQKYVSFNLEDININNGWNTDFIIYGNFIHDVINHIKFIDSSDQDKIEFGIFTENGFETLLKYFNDNFKDIEYVVFKNGVELVIELENKTLLIELINFIGYSIETLLNTIKFECHKCYFDGKNIIVYPECRKTINTGVIEKMNGNNTKFTKREFMQCYNNDYKFSIDIYKKLDILRPENGSDTINQNNKQIRKFMRDIIYEVEYYKLSKYEDRGFDIYLELQDNDDDYYDVLIKFSDMKQLMIIMPLIYKYPFINDGEEKEKDDKDKEKDGLTNSDIIYFLINQNITMKQVT